MVKLERVKGVVFNNLFLKIISVVIAFLLWLNINLTKQTTLEFVSYIEVENLPNNIYIEKIKPEKVRIILEGYKKNVKSLNISKIQAYVDGVSLKEGKNTLNVKIKGNLEDFKVVAIKPSQVIIYARKK